MGYCVRADIEAYFGKDNVKTWADLNSSGIEAEIDARVTVAINNATGIMDAMLRGGPYPIPLTWSPMPTAIVKICVQLAGDDLYTPRGAQDFDAEGRPLHRLRGERQDAREALGQIRAGQLVFDQVSTDTGAPAVVPVTTTIDDE